VGIKKQGLNTTIEKFNHNSEFCDVRLRDFYLYIFHYNFQIKKNIKKIKSLYSISMSSSTTFVLNKWQSINSVFIKNLYFQKVLYLTKLYFLFWDHWDPTNFKKFVQRHLVSKFGTKSCKKKLNCNISWTTGPI